jgi:hypothetical protein
MASKVVHCSPSLALRVQWLYNSLELDIHSVFLYPKTKLIYKLKLKHTWIDQEEHVKGRRANILTIIFSFELCTTPYIRISLHLFTMLSYFTEVLVELSRNPRNLIISALYLRTFSYKFELQLSCIWLISVHHLMIFLSTTFLDKLIWTRQFKNITTCYGNPNSLIMGTL